MPLQPLTVPCSFSPLTCPIHHLFSRTGGVLSHQKTQSFQYPLRSLCSLVLVVTILSRLRRTGESFLLNSYLSRMCKTDNSLCSACGHPIQNSSHLILCCPATGCLCRSLFENLFSLCNLWSRPWGVARLLKLHGLPPCSRPSKRVR